MTVAWIWLALTIVSSSVGNVLMKYASQGAGSGLSVYFSFPFLFGGFLFGGGLLCYMKALESLPLAVAYPTVVGSSLVFISTCSIVFFDERLSTGHIIGVLLIFAGLLLLTRHATIA